MITALFVLGIVVLAGCLVRGVLYWFDTGFGGAVWDAIMYTSCIVWPCAVVMGVLSTILFFNR